MHDLLIILRNCSIQLDGSRMDLRPGAIVNVPPSVAQNLISKGYARHAVPPAPLFVNSTDPPKKPKKASRRADGNLDE